ncbi:MAG: sugar transferase [Actinomycetota bacterium]|nr:sugar transferase [Actinomycetota bacterium]
MRSRFLISSSVTDLAAYAVAAVLASQLVYTTWFPWNSLLGNQVLPMLGVQIAAMTTMSIATARMSGHGVPRPTYGRMFAIFMGTTALTALFLVLFREAYYSRRFLIYTAVGWLVLATAHRIVRRRRPWTERIGLITGEKQLAEDLVGSPHAEVVWVLNPSFDGSIELPDRNVTLAIDLRATLSERVAQFLSSCDVAGYTIRPLTSIYEEHTGRVPLVHLAEGWEISAPLLAVAPWLPGKRVFDVATTAITAPLWLALGLLVGIYVKLASPGPAIFRQERVGKGGTPFTIVKFRTMILDAEKDGPRFATEDDERLIMGGRFLRKSRLDEIPQLWNVLTGEMSLVGPRAEQVPFAETFRQKIPFYEHRHLVRPGITGWAQVNYRYADDQADTIEKLTYDLYYIKHMSPVMDISVLWKSVWTVLTGAGAR